ncbi:hypothetical protein LARI1_G002565 [Lachnellula arida]|uniref:Coenzyme Q-binding protein COQ10 START domain-containing protein n=1 Tax=Lachnellula arida TaxID=1316785 RepID=A0A8T9BMP7_9HELO|nr:hypothetical protein LARI1_G002565 [Lachnellula arida]
MPPRYPTSEEPISAAAPVTADLIPPIPVPSHGPGGAFSVISRTRISASPLTVLNLIRDTKTWPEWNSFCPRAVIASARTSTSTRTSARTSTSTSTSSSRGKGKAKAKAKATGRRTSTSTSTGTSSTSKEGNRDFGGGDESEGWLEVGTEADVDVFLNGDGLVSGHKRTRGALIAVTVLERYTEEKEGVRRRGYRLAWKAIGWAEWQLRSERVFELVAREDGGTDFTCWETFSGVLGSVVKKVAGNTLCDRFGDYARDVKGFLEGVEVRVDFGKAALNAKRRSL